jgi:pimeloyl-ACP methyl ester carboxylesterase
MTGELSRLHMPVHLIWGGKDPLFPLLHATRAQRLLAGSELVVIENAGHSPEIEQPDEFIRALARIL